METQPRGWATDPNPTADGRAEPEALKVPVGLVAVKSWLGTELAEMGLGFGPLLRSLICGLARPLRGQV